MPNAAAKRANKPSATRWPPADEDEVARDVDPLEEEEVDEIATGVPVGSAPTPLVIGPVSVLKAGSFEPRDFAAAWYASKVSPLLGALIAPTIPRPQWAVVLQ